MIEDVSNEFDLSETVQLFTANLPAEAGDIRLNDFNIPGSPWLGPYYADMPMELTAQSKPGYVFLGWSEAVEVPIVLEGSEWKYHDLGEDLGIDWRLPDYPDSDWASGNAEWVTAMEMKLQRFHMVKTQTTSIQPRIFGTISMPEISCR